MSRSRAWALLIVVGLATLATLACGTPPRAARDPLGRGETKHPSIERLCPSVAAPRPPGSCLPEDFTGDLVQTDGHLRAYAMCMRADDGSFLVDNHWIMVERPGSPPAPLSFIQDLKERAKLLFPDFVSGSVCINPGTPHPRARGVFTPQCLAINVRDEHPTIDFLLHESEQLLATGDESTCVLLQIGAGASLARLR
jgi:hypothetical protein